MKTKTFKSSECSTLRNNLSLAAFAAMFIASVALIAYFATYPSIF